MWGGWWILPMIGMVVCMGFMAVMMWAMMRGHGFMCMGGHDHRGHDPRADLQREIRELKQEVQELRASR
jgi:hypothetical protein